MDIASLFALYVCTFLFLLSTYFFVGSDALKRSGGNSHLENTIVLSLAGIATVLDVIAAGFIVSEDISGGDVYLVFGAVYYALQVSFIPIVDNPNWKTLTRIVLAMCAVVRIVGFAGFAAEAGDKTAVYIAIYPLVHVVAVDALYYSVYMLI